MISLRLWARRGLSIFALTLVGCGGKNVVTSSTSVMQSPPTTVWVWADSDRFTELMFDLRTASKKLSEKALTFEEYVTEVSRIARGFDEIPLTRFQYCNESLSKIKLEVNQLRVALINKDAVGIKSAYKVNDFQRWVTVKSYCDYGR